MIVIDSEFQSLIPPLSDDEYDRLEKSLTENGYQDWREPIITWNGTIIDGHNRYNICNENGIEFRQMEMQFESRDAAKLWIVKNQLKRRNLPKAAIMDLKLEEKEIVARQKEAHSLANLKKGSKLPDEPNLARREGEGRTLEQLARDIDVGRESLRKMDVIKQKAKEGDPVAVKEREALISGKKKSIHGAYVAVTGKQKPRKPEETTAPDGRKICVMCGEPINEGEASSARPTVHKKCEQEYQRDWLREKRKHDDADSDLRNNVAVYTIESLKAELLASAESMKEALKESIAINESMGVQLTAKQKKDLSASVAHVIRTINRI